MKICRELVKKTSILMQHHLNLFKASSNKNSLQINNRKMSEQPIKSLSKAYSESLLTNGCKNRNSKLQKSTSQSSFSRDRSLRIRETSLDSQSVERMHTFNIKSTNISSKVLNTLKQITTGKKSFNKSSSIVSNQSNSSKCYYVEEPTGPLERNLSKTWPTLKDLLDKMRYFELLSQMSIKDRDKFLLSQDESKDLTNLLTSSGLRFQTIEEMRLLAKNSKGFAIRNSLGLQHSEDWIFNLNIGNVMFLAKMEDDELNYPTDRYHELNKDALLEKLILICSCYFCVATELRFLAMNKEIVKKDPSISSAHSDMWHAQGAFIAANFLPENCPLVDHLITSYDKYHLKYRKEDLAVSKKSFESLKSKEKKTIIKSKLLFKKPKTSKQSERNESTLGKSKSIKLLNLYVEKTNNIFPKKLQLKLSKKKKDPQSGKRVNQKSISKIKGATNIQYLSNKSTKRKNSNPKASSTRQSSSKKRKHSHKKVKNHCSRNKKSSLGKSITKGMDTIGFKIKLNNFIKETVTNSCTSKNKILNTKKSSINEQLLKKMTTGLASFASQFNKNVPKCMEIQHKLTEEENSHGDQELHHYKTRKKQSCQPKQINSNRNAITSLNSPSHSWINTFISNQEGNKALECKTSKPELKKKTKIKLFRAQMIEFQQLSSCRFPQQEMSV
ncbi:unnamed protein product [Moneuplotes crassus]|uniref:Uncharacterized protein n=1 Tax=Euplotes crassus TaxID=5936 RepID=A0AAD1XS51_EUPCR|nr:unnamed protein product [Moneuplotes crassus]